MRKKFILTEENHLDYKMGWLEGALFIATRVKNLINIKDKDILDIFVNFLKDLDQEFELVISTAKKTNYKIDLLSDLTYKFKDEKIRNIGFICGIFDSKSQIIHIKNKNNKKEHYMEIENKNVENLFILQSYIKPFNIETHVYRDSPKKYLRVHKIINLKKVSDLPLQNKKLKNRIKSVIEYILRPSKDLI
jgi:hypothetical protein